jgi:hypothetical protein
MLIPVLLGLMMWSMVIGAIEFDDYPKFEYSYRSLTESKLRVLRQKCTYSMTSNQDCLNLSAENCLLKCVSLKCYLLIYANNPLEEGEFDQRISSFKGCLTASL